MLGAYFGSTRITQGAGGLGDDAPLQAYADGVVGGNAAESTPGQLFAYHDGSLGGLGQDGPLQAYADGTVGGAAENPDMPGPLFAYHDGSLGMGADDDDAATPISVWHDGVLGNRRDGMDSFGPLQSFQDGSLGEYFSGVGSDLHPPRMRDPINRRRRQFNMNVMRGFGDTTPVTLDLGDQMALQEVKSMMALLAPEQTLTADGQKVYTPDWYTSGIWDPQASLLWQYIVSKSAALSGKDVSVTSGAQTFPNGTGVGFMIGTIAAPTTATYGPDYAKKSFPIVTSWYAAGGGPVLAPYLSLTDKTKQQRATASLLGLSTMAWYGVGAAALLGVALMMRRKR